MLTKIRTISSPYLIIDWIKQASSAHSKLRRTKKPHQNETHILTIIKLSMLQHEKYIFLNVRRACHDTVCECECCLCQEYVDLINLYVCGPADCLLAVRADVTSFHNAHQEHVRAYLHMHKCMCACAHSCIHFYEARAVYIYARHKDLFFLLREDFSSLCALSLPLFTLSKLTLAYTCSSCLYDEAVIAGLTRKLGLPAL